MRRYFFSLVAIVALLMPAHIEAQSGDASWLESVEGLELAIGRSWMAPVVFVSESVTTDFNEQGTPVSQVTTRSGPESTPMVTDDMRTLALSALIYQFDSPEHAAEGMEQMHVAQMDQWARDPRSPEMDAFDTGDLGDVAIGSEGIYTYEGLPGEESELAIALLFVQDETTVYQIFGQFLPGDHVDIATDAVRAMIAADAGNNEPVYDVDGRSTGGLWEKLNAVDLAMPEGSTVYDLQVYPVDEDAVMGNSAVVPQIDLNRLGEVPGLAGSWHIAYAPLSNGTPAATPTPNSTGAFSIELWVMEFEDSAHAAAAAFSLDATLTEPLGIVNTEGGFGSSEAEGITLVSTGFVRDEALPPGDAAVVVQARGTTVYAARVYTRDLAPTPLAERLVAHLQGTPPADGGTAESELVPSDDRWVYFPQTGDDVLYGLMPVIVRYDTPNAPPATPVG